MKKYLYSALCLMGLLATSCSNEDILIERDNNVNEINVNVSLSKFFSDYTYNDTKHDISVTEDYRTFNSEFGKYINIRTLFYDSDGNLKGELSTFSTTTNGVTQATKLAEGTYTVVTILNFADDKTEEESWWDMYDKNKLSTAYIKLANRFTKWGIMSYASQTITVREGKTTSISVTPTPVGALGYMYCQNFQYKNEATYGTIADNGVRSIALYSQKIAEGFKLDPNATDKYVYKEDSGSGMWYYLSDKLTPKDFDSSWTYFQSNLYDYLYILAPSFNATFGYEMQGDEGFKSYGEGNYTIENGKTYLVYWDWFQVGNPYFGVADNNHWHSYSSSNSLNLTFEATPANNTKKNK